MALATEGKVALPAGIPIETAAHRYTQSLVTTAAYKAWGMLSVHTPQLWVLLAGFLKLMK